PGWRAVVQLQSRAVDVVELQLLRRSASRGDEDIRIHAERCLRRRLDQYCASDRDVSEHLPHRVPLRFQLGRRGVDAEQLRSPSHFFQSLPGYVDANVPGRALTPLTVSPGRRITSSAVSRVRGRGAYPAIEFFCERASGNLDSALKSSAYRGRPEVSGTGSERRN